MKPTMIQTNKELINRLAKIERLVKPIANTIATRDKDGQLVSLSGEKIDATRYDTVHVIVGI